MNFIPTDNHKEVSLAEGLNYLQLNKGSKLYSDGLKTYEYIYFDFERLSGFCRENGNVIGGTFDQTIRKMIESKWLSKYKFYIALS